MLKIRRVDSCHQQQTHLQEKHQLQNLEDTEHIHIRTTNTKESHMRPLMFPEDQEEEGGDRERLMGCVVPSVRRESRLAPRCRISLRLSHRPAGTMSLHPHLRRQVKPYWKDPSGQRFCGLSDSSITHRSYGRAREAAPPLSPSGTCDTPTVRRLVGSGWTAGPQNTLPTKHQQNDKVSVTYECSATWAKT